MCEYREEIHALVHTNMFGGLNWTWKSSSIFCIQTQPTIELPTAFMFWMHRATHLYIGYSVRTSQPTSAQPSPHPSHTPTQEPHTRNKLAKFHPYIPHPTSTSPKRQSLKPYIAPQDAPSSFLTRNVTSPASRRRRRRCAGGSHLALSNSPSLFPLFPLLLPQAHQGPAPPKFKTNANTMIGRTRCISGI